MQKIKLYRIYMQFSDGKHWLDDCLQPLDEIKVIYERIVEEYRSFGILIYELDPETEAETFVHSIECVTQ